MGINRRLKIKITVYRFNINGERNFNRAMNVWQ